MDVRRSFAAKVSTALQHLQVKPEKAAKWAACLPLAAMDPVVDNCQAAHKSLIEFITQRRQEP